MERGRGAFVDLGVLDVQQIFGRAGRPQFDVSGEGIIITRHAKLAHYLQMLTQAYPIESKFISRLSDHLNAEVARGAATPVPITSPSYLTCMRCDLPCISGGPGRGHLRPNDISLVSHMHAMRSPLYLRWPWARSPP